MKILVCDSISEEGLKILRDAGHQVDVKTGMTPEQVAEVIAPYHAVIVRSATKIRKAAIEAGRNLKAIARGGIGLDNIDVDVARQKGIQILNTPVASAISVAELAVGMMFALCRRIPQAAASMKAGKWEKKKFEGTELYGKTLGVVGTGNIGRETIKRAQALGMKVIVTKKRLGVIPPELSELGVEVTTLENMLPKADVISLHLPKAEGYVIDEKEFAMMKKGVLLVNCARGGVVNEKALISALKSGKVAAAAIDVFEKEPTDNTELLALENVIAAPHIGASTEEGQFRVGTEICEKVVNALR